MGFWRKSPEPDVNKPLTEEERAKFERHLNRTRFTSVDEQTGFFSALSALPRMVMPTEWLPVALEAMSAKENVSKYELSMMMRLYNEVMGKSAEDPGSVVPKDADSAHSFCCGYITGLQMDDDVIGVISSQAKLGEFLTTISRMSDRCILDEQEHLEKTEKGGYEGWVTRMAKKLPGWVRKIHKFLRSQA